MSGAFAHVTLVAVSIARAPAGLLGSPDRHKPSTLTAFLN